jgi:hypothetical protein
LGDAGEEGRLSRQHAELADEVAGFDDDSSTSSSRCDE